MNLETAKTTSCSKTPVSHNDYMGFLATHKNLAKDFARDTIAKFLENVMKGEQTKIAKKPWYR